MAANLIHFDTQGPYAYACVTENGVNLGILHQEVDGFYVYSPNPELSGCFSQGILRELATKLEELNAPWDAIIEEYHSTHPAELIPTLDDLKDPDPFTNSRLGDLT